MHNHPANKAIHDEVPPLAERIGIGVAAAMATGAFLILQAGFIVAWIVAVRSGVRIDNHGLTILNLLLSLQAAFAAPLILLATRRQTEHDRIRAETDHETMSRIETKVETLMREKFGA